MSSLRHAGPSTTVAEPGRAEFPAFGWWSTVSMVAVAVCALVVWVSPPIGVVVAVACLAVAVGWADVAWRRIPNAVMLVGAGFTAVVAVAWDGAQVEAVLVGATLTCLPALVLHVMNPRWVGFGDVKLLAVIGGLMALLWVMGGVVALWAAMLLALASHAFVPAAWRRAVPFGFWLSLCAVPVSIFSAGSIVS